MAIHPLIRRGSLNQVFGDFEKEISRLFERNQDTLNAEVGDWLPAMDIKEEPKQFVVHADIPGVEFKDIDVSIDNQNLVIKGQRESEKKEDKEGYVRIERAKGSFYRALRLPESANVEKIDAKYNQGVLTVTIPKREQSVGRKIEVKGEKI